MTFFIIANSDQSFNHFSRVEDQLRHTKHLFVSRYRPQFTLVGNDERFCLIHSLAHPVLFEKQQFPYRMINSQSLSEAVYEHGDVYLMTPDCQPGINDVELLNRSILAYVDRTAGQEEFRDCNTNQVVRSDEYSLCTVFFSAYKVPGKDLVIIILNSRCVIGGGVSGDIIGVPPTSRMKDTVIAPKFYGAKLVGEHHLFVDGDHFVIDLFHDDLKSFSLDVAVMSDLPYQIRDNSLEIDASNLHGQTMLRLDVLLGKFFEKWIFEDQCTHYDFLVYRP